MAENTANTCVWSHHLPVYQNMTTSMAVTTGKVSFDVPSVTAGSYLKVLTAWCRIVHHSFSCWLVNVAVPARLTHCYENIQASHSEHIYIWLTGCSWTVVQSQTQIMLHTLLYNVDEVLLQERGETWLKPCFHGQIYMWLNYLSKVAQTTLAFLLSQRSENQWSYPGQISSNMTATV